jgi:L-methionine (R)-S-oxide reductase
LPREGRPEGLRYSDSFTGSKDRPHINTSDGRDKWYQERRLVQDYSAALEQVTTAIREAGDGKRAIAAAVGVLKQQMPDYNWVGIYLLDGNELVLGPFVGKPSPHTRIPLGRGVCGAAAAEQATIIVDDVNADPRYLACNVETRSEIVVPIMLDGEVLGEIDIDSDRLAAFGPKDQALLESVAALLAPQLRTF